MWQWMACTKSVCIDFLSSGTSVLLGLIARYFPSLKDQPQGAICLTLSSPSWTFLSHYLRDCLCLCLVYLSSTSSSFCPTWADMNTHTHPCRHTQTCTHTNKRGTNKKTRINRWLKIKLTFGAHLICFQLLGFRLRLMLWSLLLPSKCVCRCFADAVAVPVLFTRKPVLLFMKSFPLVTG